MAYNIVKGILQLGFAALLPLVATAQKSDVPKDPGSKENLLPLVGRITNGGEKLDRCQVYVFQDNERVATLDAEKSGKFGVTLVVGRQYALEFHREGFLPKRVLVDAHADLPEDELIFMPLVLDVSLLPADKYTGADTDVLDFPFAIVRYDPKSQSFVQDQQYTADMMRANGAVLLMAGRATKD